MKLKISPKSSFLWAADTHTLVLATNPKSDEKINYWMKIVKKHKRRGVAGKPTTTTAIPTHQSDQLILISSKFSPFSKQNLDVVPTSKRDII